LEVVEVREEGALELDAPLAHGAALEEHACDVGRLGFEPREGRVVYGRPDEGGCEYRTVEETVLPSLWKILVTWIGDLGGGEE
jgi:hypothetical protein